MQVSDKIHEIRSFVLETKTKAQYTVQAEREGKVITLILGNQALTLTPTDIQELMDALTQANMWRANVNITEY